MKKRAAAVKRAKKEDDLESFINDLRKFARAAYPEPGQFRQSVCAELCIKDCISRLKQGKEEHGNAWDTMDTEKEAEEELADAINYLKKAQRSSQSPDMKTELETILKMILFSYVSLKTYRIMKEQITKSQE